MNHKYFRVLLATVAISSVSWAQAESHKASLSLRESMENYVFDQKSGYLTDALLVIKDGNIFYEKYDRGFHKDSRHYIWSITKTLFSALVGIAVKEGRLQLDDPISLYVSSKEIQKNPEKGKIKVRDLLSWSSGLHYNEDYEDSASPADSSPIQQLGGREPLKNMADYILSHDFYDEPGVTFRYSTGDSTLLGAVLKGVYGDKYDQMPWEKLFGPLGMKNVTIEQDQSGVFVSGSGAWVSARDLAQFGQFYLDNGKTKKGDQLLPDGWRDYSWSPVPNYWSSNKNILEELVPAHHWWTVAHGINKSESAYETLPRDTMFALGHWGQSLTVIPSENVIIVRYGEDKEEKRIDRARMVHLVLDYVRGVPREYRSKKITLPRRDDPKVTENMEPYHSWKITLGVGHYISSYCACLYVMERTQSFCQSFAENQASQFVSTTVDKEKKVVRGSILGTFFVRRGEYKGVRRGCTLY